MSDNQIEDLLRQITGSPLIGFNNIIRDFPVKRIADFQEVFQLFFRIFNLKQRAVFIGPGALQLYYDRRLKINHDAPLF